MSIKKQPKPEDAKTAISNSIQSKSKNDSKNHTRYINHDEIGLSVRPKGRYYGLHPDVDYK